MGIVTVLVAASVIREGQLAGVIAVVGFAVFTVFLARAAIAGMVLDNDGIKVRGAIRTNRWRWDEVERFELQEQGSKPRLRVYLIDGTTQGIYGFYARSVEEEARSQALFRALEERLEAEQAKRTNARSPVERSF
jgi:hypothetical protein